jgi:hypothetical protein
MVLISPAVKKIINPIDVANDADKNGCTSEDDGDDGHDSDADIVADASEECNVDLED